MEATDLELVERVQNGDVDAYEVLLRRHQQRVFSYVTRMTGSPALGWMISGRSVQSP